VGRLGETLELVRGNHDDVAPFGAAHANRLAVGDCPVAEFFQPIT